MQPQRDRFGRYLPGHKGGPGRPKGTHNPAYANIVEEVISPEDWRALINRTKHYALNGPGHMDLLRFLAPYLLGRPTVPAPAEDENDSPNPTPLPPEPVQLPAQASPSLLQELPEQLDRDKSERDEPIRSSMPRRVVLKSAANRRRW